MNLYYTFDKADLAGSVTKSSAAPDMIFKANEDCKKLNSKQAVEIHQLVAKILFDTKQVRTDTCTAISFLTTRAREPENDDWAKLVHIMKYIRGTSNLPLILSDTRSGILKWWIDG